MSLNFQHIDASWHDCIKQALKNVNAHYLHTLEYNILWLPGVDKILNAFSIPVNQVNYILLGESPYPRPHSANGYAFWDAAVGNLWSPTGMSKEVNRATSLRNIIKMLLVTEELLNPNHTSQTDISAIDKSRLIKTNPALFSRLLQHGFLLLNASLVLQNTTVKKEAHTWQPFLQYVLEFLVKKRPHVQLLLLGQIASTVDKLLPHLCIRKIYAEHPYNISFITNPAILQFFKPMHLLLA